MSERTIDICLDDIELEVSGDYDPYVPAKTNCLPEDSHPEEGGYFELYSIVYRHKSFEVDLTTILEHRHDEINDICYEQIICSD